jgi:pectate lyase
MHLTKVRRRLGAAGIAACAVAVAAATLALGNGAFASTLFSDDFESGGAASWTHSGGSWSVTTDGSQVYRQSSTSSTARAAAGNAAWTDTAVRADVKPLAFNGTNRYAAVTARTRGGSAYYLAVRNTNTVELGRLSGATTTALASKAIAVTPGTWYHLRLEVFGSTLTGYVNGAPVGSAQDATFSAGQIGLATYNTDAEFDNVVVDNAPGPVPSASPTPTVTATPTPSGPPPPTDAPTGFASVPAHGENGTTGGAGGPVVTVSTAADFADYATRPGPYVIRVNGVITLSAMQNVTSNKTVIGVGNASGFTGYGLNVGLPVDNAVTAPPADAVHNVIIRNLNIAHSADDAINVQMFSYHVWIDHNDLCCGYDGLVDIKRGSSLITVSWNHTHNHTKNMLLGHDDGNAAQDVGYLKVSYHHNFFDQTPQRNPRVRFGEPVHVYNNYYLHNTDVGVACQADAGCLIEGNVFESVEEPVSNHYAGPAGRCVARNNLFIGTEPGQPECSGTVQEASAYYTYTLEDPNTVKASVLAGVGTGHIGQ